MCSKNAFDPNGARNKEALKHKLNGRTMAGTNIEQKALGLLKTFEKAGKPISRIMIHGRKIELVLERGSSDDEFENIDMRHGKT